MNKAIIITVFFFLVVPIPILAQEMGFYKNSRYDFSFEVPTSWRYQEGVSIDGKTTYQVLMYPSEFGLDNANATSGANLLDLSTAFAGLGFQIESPLIGVIFENIPNSKVSKLNANELKDYVLNNIRESEPSAKILDSNVKTESWGWEVSVLYTYDVKTGFGSGWPYVEQDISYFFKDRESYTVFYAAHENFYKHYRPIFDHTVDTLVIKGVVVPEFHEIAIIILAGSISIIVLFTKKFNFPCLK